MTDQPAQQEKQSARSVREFEVVRSDRISLIDAANTLVGHMIMKQVWPMANSSIPVDNPLTDEEVVCYESALGFLKRQFDLGYRKDKIADRRLENETSFGG